MSEVRINNTGNNYFGCNSLCYIQKRLLNKNIKLNNIRKKCRVWKKKKNVLTVVRTVPWWIVLYTHCTLRVYISVLGSNVKVLQRALLSTHPFLFWERTLIFITFLLSSRRMLRLFHNFHAFLCARFFVVVVWSFWLFSYC